MNRVDIMGRLGADPETRSFQNGGRVCNLRVVTSESWKDKNTGEKKERAEWHTVAVMADPLITLAERYLKKGARVLITGQLQTRKWQDQSGADRYTTEIVLRPYKGELQIIDWPENASTDSRGAYSNAGQGSAPASGWGAPAGDMGSDMDDEVPFSAEWR